MVKRIKYIFAAVAALLLISNFYAYNAGAVYVSAENGYSAVYAGSAENVPAAKQKQYVYAGGMPLGLELNTRGLIIIGKTDVVTSNGLVNPTKNSNIEIGDILMSAEGIEINSADELSEVINREAYKGREINVTVRRRGQEIKTKIFSALDVTSGKYKTGLWVRQDTFGVGTLTFVRGDLRFAALGHPVVDSDTKDILQIRSGKALACSIAGCIRGERGRPGELKGMIIKDCPAYGTVDKNCIYGIYGNLGSVLVNDIYPDLMEVMPRSQVRPGKAYILTTLNGGQPKKFEIEIIKTSYQAKPADRSMVIKITDYRLLSVTGGIVQGMSGSPIIQNEKLCGAVTHVFVNDPTRGYGLYADWMITQ